MKNVKLEDVVKSVLTAETDHEAAKIIERYCAHVVKKEKLQWVYNARKEQQTKLEASSFTKAIKYIDSSYREMLFPGQSTDPTNRDILDALKLIAEAFREREDYFYREAQR